MTDFIIKKLPYDLSSHAGMAYIGQYLKYVNVNALIGPTFPVRSSVANSEILKSYLALLYMGKSDFDAIESFRDNTFFKRALGHAVVPYSPTLRQRMDTHAASWSELAPQMNQLLLGSRLIDKAIDFGTLACGYTPVDLGKFDTNYLASQLAAVAMNLLRLIGRNTFNEFDAPVRHKAKRRRIKTVRRELMFKADHMIHHAGRMVLGLGESEPAFAVFERH